MRKVVGFLGLLMLVGCSSTPEPQKVPKGNPYVIGAPICVAWVHDSIVNSTGDYQACKYNHRANEASVEKCMQSKGWRRETSEQACNLSSYTFEQRQSCVKQSIVGGKVDHQMIKRCLAVYTPKAQKQLNHAKLQDMIRQCMAHKDRTAQQQCLNNMAKKK